MTRIAILCEDAYGRRFFELLIKRLYDEGFLDRRISVGKVKSLRGKFNRAHGRKIASMKLSYDRIVIVVDSEERNKDDVSREVYSFIEDEETKRITRVVVCGYSLEEWICLGECLEKVKRECLEHLIRERGYRKRNLPSYADRIDLHALRDKSIGFGDFLNALSHLAFD